jgi:hypothetical protein
MSPSTSIPQFIAFTVEFPPPERAGLTPVGFGITTQGVLGTVSVPTALAATVTVLYLEPEPNNPANAVMKIVELG